LDVIAYEKAWNKGTFCQGLARFFGFKDKPNPTLIDWVLFGKNPDRSLEFIKLKFSESYEVVHTPDGKNALELNPEGGFDQFVSYEPGVVIDTHHFRRGGRHGEDGFYLPRFGKYINLLKGNIRQVHIHPFRDEVKRLLRGESPGQLSDMLRELNAVAPEDCDLVLEIEPMLSTQNDLINKLRKIRIEVLNIMERK